MRKSHPLANKPLSMDDYLNADHIAPTPYTVTSVVSSIYIYLKND